MSGLFGGGQHTSTSDTKLSSFRMQTATYGLPVPIVLGTTRISGNIIDYIDFTATPHTTTQQTGKGGGSSSSNTSYTYNVAVAIGLCEGLIVAVKKVWKDKEIKNLAELGLSLVQDKQWSYMLTKHSDRALHYHNFSYVAGYIDLGNSDSLPNLSFEVAGQYLGINTPYGYDCEVKDVFTQILTNYQWGLGLPASLLGDWTEFANYCMASGIFFSHAITDAVATNSLLEDMMKTCNSEFVCSEGLMKIVPYCEEGLSVNGVTYTPNTTIQYYFDDDSIVCDGDSPAVIIERIRYDDTFNSVSLEIMNRAKDYNLDLVEWTDPNDSATRNVISGSSITAHWITNRDIATMIARLMVWRSLQIRNTYKFTVPYDYYLLEPMDVVAITDTRLLLNKLPVRIKKITETEKGLEIEAEDVFNGATSPVYSSSSGTTVFSPVNNNVLAGNVNPPVVVVVSPTVTQNGSYEAWIAVSGDNSNWGGCSVYTSYDNTSFAKIGTIRNPARHGVLTTTLATSTTDIDTTNTLGVSIYTGQLLSGTVTDRDNLNTLMYVDGELISYQTATLTGTNTYNLTSLKRGVYGSAKAQHDAGKKWARLDGSLFKVTFSSADIGKQMYLKFTSFNVFGSNEQLLSDVVSYPFTATVVGAYVPPSTQIAQVSSDLNNQINTVNTQVNTQINTVNTQVTNQIDAVNAQVTNQIDAVNAQVTALNNQLGDIGTALSNIIGG